MTSNRTLLALVFVVAMIATPAAAAVAPVSATTDATGATNVHGVSDATTPGSTTPLDGCNYPLTVTDATGEQVTLDEPADRVVTLGPASAQTMWELDAQSKVVGTTQFAAYLDGAGEKANVSGAGRTYVSVETVVAQEPDLVLAENITNPDTVSQLRDAGVTVYYFNASESIQDVYEKVGMTGQLVGECDAAVDTVREMKEELAIVAEATDGEEETDFLYAFYGYTAGEKTFIHEALTRAGGNNLAVGVVEFPPSGYAPINPEPVAGLDVEWLVFPNSEAAIPDNAAYEETIAMQEGNLLAVDENHISQPAPRVALAVRQAAQTWYPDAYAAADDELRGNVEVEVNLYADADAETTTEMTTTEMTSDETTADGDGTESETDASTEMTEAGTTTDAEGGSPGFGTVTALVAGALLVVTALARRD